MKGKTGTLKHHENKVMTYGYLQTIVMALNELLKYHPNSGSAHDTYMNLIHPVRVNIAYHLNAGVVYNEKEKKYVIQKVEYIYDTQNKKYRIITAEEYNNQ